MPEQNPTVQMDGFAYINSTPMVTEATVRRTVDDVRTVLELGPRSNGYSVVLPDSAWVQLVPLLIETLPEPARSQAIAAVDQLRAEANVIPHTLTEQLDAARNGQEFGAALLGFMSAHDAAESDQ